MIWKFFRKSKRFSHQWREVLPLSIIKSFYVRSFTTILAYRFVYFSRKNCGVGAPQICRTDSTLPLKQVVNNSRVTSLSSCFDAQYILPKFILLEELPAALSTAYYLGSLQIKITISHHIKLLVCLFLDRTWITLRTDVSFWLTQYSNQRRDTPVNGARSAHDINSYKSLSEIFVLVK